MKRKDNKINKKKKQKKGSKISTKALAVTGGAVLLTAGVLTSDSFRAKEIDYPQFEKLVNRKEIKEIKFSDSNSNLILVDKKGNLFKTVDPGYETFRQEHLAKGIKFSEKKSVSPIPAIILALTFSALSGIKKQMNVGKDKIKVLDGNNIPKVRFKDISGLKEVKTDLELAVEYLKNPKSFSDVGATMPTGILLYGPPGTGKTMIAKAVAGEANVPFFNISGSNFVELYAGGGARTVRALFDEARKNAPCIIFIDEIDAVAKKRVAGPSNGSNDEREQTVNEFLTQLDGFGDNEGILLIGATNRLETLDEAFIRPGRFGKHIKIPLPRNKEERFEILKIHASNKKVDDSILKHMAKISVGFSGADLQNFLNECAILQKSDKKEAIDLEIVDKALFKIATKGSKILSKERKADENRIISWHEAGHALASKLYGEEFIQVTISGSSSGIGGFSLSHRGDDKLLRLSDLKREVKVLYSGRIAESFIYGDDVTIGASNDIEKASEIISNMISYYGMNNSKTMLNLDVIEDKKHLIEEAKILSHELYTEAYRDLEKNKVVLEEIANTLLEEETLYDTDIEKILAKYEIC